MVQAKFFAHLPRLSALLQTRLREIAVFEIFDVRLRVLQRSLRIPGE